MNNLTQALVQVVEQIEGFDSSLLTTDIESVSHHWATISEVCLLFVAPYKILCLPIYPCLIYYFHKSI